MGVKQINEELSGDELSPSTCEAECVTKDIPERLGFGEKKNHCFFKRW